MFVVLLRFGSEKSKAGQYMEAHNDWLRSGFEDGVFVLAGSIAPSAGGAILATGVALDALQDRVRQDPFVAENIVEPEIIEIAPARVDERLAFFERG